MQTLAVTMSAADYEQATSYRRLAARGVDLAAAFFLLLPLSMGVVVLLGRLTGSALTAEASGWVGGACFFIALIAYDAIMTHLLGKTLGKMALGLRVVDGQGTRLGWGRSLLRTTIAYASGVATVFLIVASASILGWVFLRGMSTYTRFPHDRVSKSFVVREVKGEPKKALQGTGATDSAVDASPIADLERLWEQGIISREEYERKRREEGL
jgi:uncharacterized RDD family membrane protein YckC